MFGLAIGMILGLLGVAFHGAWKRHDAYRGETFTQWQKRVRGY